MSNLGSNTKYVDNTTTEWEDILASKGILPKREDVLKAAKEIEDAREEAEEEARLAYDPLADKSLEELDELDVCITLILLAGMSTS